MIHHLQHIADLVKICELKGIRHVVVSPGSRNAPLIELFFRIGNFHLHSIVDERSAAFYGMGIALATHEAVALLCTSGTAVLNYAPALAEAYYQRVPLIAITADRPEHLIGQQDNQTIRQVNVFQNFTKDSVHLHLPVHDDFELEIQHFGLNKIINTALSGIRGPVHINVPLAEPLYVALPPASQNIRISPSPEIENKNLNLLVEAWHQSTKALIVCGEGRPNQDLNSLLTKLSGKALVLAEPISNCYGGQIIQEIDRLILQAEQAQDTHLLPDLLISFGGPVVSKRIKEWLQKQSKLVHFRIAEEEDHVDTYQNLTAQVLGCAFEILSVLESEKHVANDGFLNHWQELYNSNLQLHWKALEQLPYSDLKVFESIVHQLPLGCILHLGNSSPVRYAQLFNLSTCSAVYSNRGVSGIDGCLSTAAGIASQTNELNIAILGDLSFVYDSNGLWNSKLPKNLKIIVINNDGGGIFRLLPGPSYMDAFEEFMETKHPVNIEKLVSAFGIEYFGCNSKSELESTIQRFMESKTGPSLLEIKTPRLVNAEVYKEYIERIMSGVGSQESED